LAPHPEGGFYRQIHRSPTRVQPLDARAERTALTTIYFLLAAHDVSRWHQVASDEVWHLYEGAPLELFTADAAFTQVSRHRLGEVGDDDQRPVHVVSAFEWQAARSSGAYTLVGCTVGPGFEFADFVLLRDRAVDAERVRRMHPAYASFI
jgi:predicted cupin superfamily sugar epimerase